MKQPNSEPTEPNKTKPTDVQQLEHDKYLEELGASRISKAHGGELVEAISMDDLEPMSDPECKHENMIRDETETMGNAFVCSNAKCGIVAIYNKGEKEDVSREQ